MSSLHVFFCVAAVFYFDISKADSNSTCGVFANCVAYYDGCNSCSCDLDTEMGAGAMCTEMYCETMGDARCTACEDGYELLDGECGELNCGGFLNCQSYYDGCNTCSCMDDGTEACTEMACDQYGSKRCSDCVDGFEVVDGECGLVNCGGFRNCQGYYDGCNSCGCTEDGEEMCTLKYCEKYEDTTEDTRCTSCVEGYVCNRKL